MITGAYDVDDSLVVKCLVDGNRMRKMAFIGDPKEGNFLCDTCKAVIYVKVSTEESKEKKP